MQNKALVIGGGIFGLFASINFKNKGYNVELHEMCSTLFEKASTINQARVHSGFHYPRSYKTAKESLKYRDRFIDEFKEAVYDDFKHYYAVPELGSQVSAEYFSNFINFLDDSKLRSTPSWLKNIKNSWLVYEPSFDPSILHKILKNKAKEIGVNIFSNSKVKSVNKKKKTLTAIFDNGEEKSFDKIVNATYSGLNNLLENSNLPLLDLEYELCEVVLIKLPNKYKKSALTIMDGPFGSIMPYGKSGYHSLTHVTYTPHFTSEKRIPKFGCQDFSDSNCSIGKTYSCQTCLRKPKTNFILMKKFLNNYIDVEVKYVKSLFTIKTILKSRDIDDARPTLIKDHFQDSSFISVLGGKISTIYDLEL